MAYPIRFSDAASKQFQKLRGEKLKERIAAALEYISKEPLIGKPLQGEFKGCYSYRVGDYRIVYVFKKEEKCMGIMKVENRKDVYR
jgi:addiction module RelE/StbE family toxin